MSSITFVAKRSSAWHLPEWALVLGFSLGGMVVSLVVAATTWIDGPIP